MKETFDYIVIGSGAAGSIVATRLAEDPGVNVLVLEAGITDSAVTVRMPGAQAYPLEDRRRTWRFETGPEPDLDGRTITHVRGRMLGGSSSLNGMVYVRGNPRDFDGWASLGLPDWSYAHCLPYFKKLETNDRGANDYRGGDGPIGVTTHKADWPIFQAFLKAGEQAGHPVNEDYNAFRQEGTCIYQANIRRGVRASAGLAYLRPAVKDGRVELRLNALVSRIRFGGNKRAVGIDYIGGGEAHSVNAEREIILCGGAYNSPQVLMLSGVGPRQHLSSHGIATIADLPGVGQGLQDHVVAQVRYLAARPGISPGVGMNVLQMGAVGAQWLLLGKGLGATNFWETGTFFRSHADVDYCNIQHEFVPLVFDYGQGKPVFKEGIAYQACLMRPRSRGFVELMSADPAAHPRIVNNYLQHQDDQREMIAAVKHTDEIIHQPAWDGMRGDGECPPLRNLSDADALTWLRTVASTQYHPSATCRMGADDNAVVDAEGRVHGVTGLRVIDASVMPRITSGNLNCPTMMIAEKLSDRMRGRSLPPQSMPYADMVKH